jgi:hypothetical protein
MEKKGEEEDQCWREWKRAEESRGEQVSVPEKGRWKWKWKWK